MLHSYSLTNIEVYNDKDELSSNVLGKGKK